MSTNYFHEIGTAGRVSFFLLFILLGIGLIPQGVAAGQTADSFAQNPPGLMEVFNPAILDVASSNPWMPGGRDGRIDLADLAVFSYYWMMQDTVPPDPNPAQWGKRGGIVNGQPSPGATPTEIIMTAKPATDNWGWDVAYQFECIKINNQPASVKSPWLYYPAGIDPTWFATGLQEGTTYTFVVRAAEIRVPGTLEEAGYVINPTGFTLIKPEDVSRNFPKSSNWTADSVPASATTDYESNPPFPNPMTWQIPIVRCNINGQWYDFMQATVAVDPEGTVVQYQVQETNTGYLSPWQAETDMPFVPVGIDPAGYTGPSFWIPAGGEFAMRQYQVRARDTSPNMNTTNWSTPPLQPQR